RSVPTRRSSDLENSGTLRLRESHSGEYAFSLTTEQGESYSGLPGVSISVTGKPLCKPSLKTQALSTHICCVITFSHHMSTSSAGGSDSSCNHRGRERDNY